MINQERMAGGSNGAVLLVEDDELIRTALEAGLELSGYAVVTAGDGTEALALLGESLPNVVVLDLGLPAMGGEAFAAKLRERGLRPRIPILLISADIDAAEVAERIRAESFLSKPLNLATLLREVARLAACSAGRSATPCFQG